MINFDCLGEINLKKFIHKVILKPKATAWAQNGSVCQPEVKKAKTKPSNKKNKNSQTFLKTKERSFTWVMINGGNKITVI